MLTLLLLITTISYSQKKAAELETDTTSECLKFTCTVTAKKTLENPVEAVLFLDNQIIDHVTLDKKNKFEYTLKCDAYYIIQISSPFYITRYAVINTNVPNRIKNDESYFFIHDMELELQEQPKVYYAPTVDSDILDEPITIIRYLNEDENFGIDPKYTDRVKRELRAFKKNIDKLQSDQNQKE